MNIALEKTQEFVNGTKRREYGDAFVRGNNGEAPSPSSTTTTTASSSSSSSSSCGVAQPTPDGLAC